MLQAEEMRAAVEQWLPDTAVERIRNGRDRVLSLRRRTWRQLNPGRKLEQPIFFIGCPRSGTTIAVDLFARHPHVAHWSEAKAIWDPQHYDDPQADHLWTASDVTTRHVEHLHETFEHYRRMKRRPRFVNKHPRNSVRIEFLREAFPDAYFIHVIRDGRAVVNSIVNRVTRDAYRHDIPFGDFCKPPDWPALLRDDPYEQAALQWREIVRYVRAASPALGDRYVEARYEDLCPQPRSAYAHLFDFCGLPETNMTRIPDRLQDANARHIKQLDASQLRTIMAVQGELLAELGYPM